MPAPSALAARIQAAQQNQALAQMSHPTTRPADPNVADLIAFYLRAGVPYSPFDAHAQRNAEIESQLGYYREGTNFPEASSAKAFASAADVSQRYPGKEKELKALAGKYQQLDSMRSGNFSWTPDNPDYQNFLDNVAGVEFGQWVPGMQDDPEAQAALLDIAKALAAAIQRLRRGR